MQPDPQRDSEGSSRLEFFSDAVMAIILTVLIFEVRFPALPSDPSAAAVVEGLREVGPQLASFSLSFLTVCVFWVQHHHIMRAIRRTDWQFLWLNNLLLFFLAVMPLTTSMLGDYPSAPIIVSLYALNIALAAAAFVWLAHHAWFGARLADADLSEVDRRRELRAGYLATASYVAAAILSFVFIPLTLILFIVTPCLFVVPGLFEAKEGDVPDE